MSLGSRSGRPPGTAGCIPPTHPRISLRHLSPAQMSRGRGHVASLLLALLLVGCGAGPAPEGAAGTPSGDATAGAPDVPPPAPSVHPSLTPVESGTTQLLQAVSVVDPRVIWVSGHGGTWGRTLDAGTTWETGVVPGQDSLQFRDVHAVHADTALLLAAGPGDRSRIFRTVDGGRGWTEVLRNLDPDAFFDCLDLWESVDGAPRRGVAFSDAVEGEFVVLITEDGGASWTQVPPGTLPPAEGTEGAFAASGTCVVTVGTRHGWIGTGAGTAPRVLRTTDGGTTWTAAPTPLPAGEAAGIASLVFRDTLQGWALGGISETRDPVRTMWPSPPTAGPPGPPRPPPGSREPSMGQRWLRGRIHPRWWRWVPGAPTSRRMAAAPGWRWIPPPGGPPPSPLPPWAGWWARGDGSRDWT